LLNLCIAGDAVGAFWSRIRRVAIETSDGHHYPSRNQAQVTCPTDEAWRFVSGRQLAGRTNLSRSPAGRHPVAPARSIGDTWFAEMVVFGPRALGLFGDGYSNASRRDDESLPRKERES
jgi:hypothetical protein